MENQPAEEAPAESIFDSLQREQTLMDAGYGLRFANLIADTVIIFIISSVVAFALTYLVVVMGWVDAGDIIAWSESTRLGAMAVRQLIGIVLSLGIYAIFEGVTKGRTVGKFITGTVAVQMDGSPITWRDAFVRSLCRFIPFEPFSTFSDGGPWHDRLSKTRVVHVRKTFIPAGNVRPDHSANYDLKP